MDREHVLREPSASFAWWATLLLGMAPPLCVVYGLNGSWSWVAWGSFAWIAAVLLKMPSGWIVHLLLSAGPAWLSSMGLGLISGIAELSIAAYLFASGPPGNNILREILAFTIGAGCTETLFVLGASLLSKPGDEKIDFWIKGARQSLCVQHVLLVERVIALSGHVGARGLVCVAVYGAVPWLAALAVVTFSLVDGLAAYGESRNWNWFDPRTCHRFYGFCASISVLEAVLFALASAILL